MDTTRKSLITSTALASLVGSAVMGLGANLPLALAPGMGLNAYFTCAPPDPASFSNPHL